MSRRVPDDSHRGVRPDGVIHRVDVRIAIVHPLPLFRDGALVALEQTGHLVETPADVLAWVRRQATNVVLLTVLSDHDWTLLGQLRDAAVTSIVVAILDGNSTAVGVRAVRAGARSVLRRDASAATLRRTVEATIDGQAVLPVALAAAMASDVRTRREPSAEHLAWLRQLASGSTVARLAADAGYSERAMYRLLRALYQQLGVRTRMQAVMRAQEAGLL
jgi:DNA-binding NarL/FixJ family response regulator